MTGTKKVSVIMSTYNEPVQYVQEAVSSVLSQSLRPQEFIVIVDEKNNDEVTSYLKNIDDPIVRLIINNSPQGLASCRNAGIALARKDYVALMDADDVMSPNRLEVQCQYLEEHQLDGVFSHMQYIDEAGVVLNTFEPGEITSLPRDFFLRHYFAHPTGFFKAQVLKKYPYNESLRRSQDAELWLRLISADCKLQVVPEILLRYRLYPHDSLEKRIKRQRSYAKYGLQAAWLHAKDFWRSPFYWWFLLRRSWYWFVTHLPSASLRVLLRLRS